MTLLTKRYGLSLTHIVPEDSSPGAPAELHGHNFKVDVTLRGEPDISTGLITLPAQGEISARDYLDNAFHELIFKKFNKKRVNDSLEHGTGEFLAIEFLRILQNSLLGEAVVSVQLVETRKNRFICTLL